MTTFYEIVDPGSPPLKLVEEVKPYLKVTTNADDVYLRLLIDSVVEYGEDYTGQQFRTNTWKVLFDEFFDRMEILRTPINTITHVKYTVSSVLTTVDSADYYLKQRTSYPLILLGDGKSWPTDGDDIEQGIEIQFVCKAAQQMSVAKRAMLAHLAHLYRNRGDCSVLEAVEKSGASEMYDFISIPRV